MAKRYVPFHTEKKQFAKTSGGLTNKLSEATVVGHTVKEKEAWERLGYELQEVEIVKVSEVKV